MSAALPTALYLAEQVRAIERAAESRHGVSAQALMERAGQAAWECFRGAWPDARRVAVVCGAGNNGGDGYVFARHALQNGRNVRVAALAAPGGAARAACDALGALGVAPQPFSASFLDRADAIVDAVFGTGLDREVGGPARAAIEAMNAHGKPILAIDLPSGLHADTGRVLGVAVRADATVSLLGLKVGLFTGAGPEQAGRVLFSDLDVPAGAYADIRPATCRIDLDGLRAELPRRRRDAHKGDFGHVLVIGGDLGMSGAARMAGEAAARSGSGLTSIATRTAHAAMIAAARPELMAHGVERAADLAPLLARATVVAIGPGLGQGDWGAALFARALESGLPLVVDADALNLLAREPCRHDDWVLTPHPGEAARLLGATAAAVQADRLGAARELQSRYGGVAVLKGCGTVVADAAGNTSLCSQGNPGMASGGMGDILTGVIAGLRAQRFPPDAAARLGVCLHAAAADACAAEGERGMLAMDLLSRLRRLANPAC